MQPYAVPVLPVHTRIHPRSALVTSADLSFRQRLRQILTGLRWQVREAEGGAQAWAEAESSAPEAVIIDSWLPDLDLTEFLSDFRGKFPHIDIVMASGSTAEESPRGPYRQELLYAMRRCQDTDTAVWNTAPALSELKPQRDAGDGTERVRDPAEEMETRPPNPLAGFAAGPTLATHGTPLKIGPIPVEMPPRGQGHSTIERLPELVGNAPCMLEVSRRVRLVAQRNTPVLIEGPTGSGKELVAEALHRLSLRSRRPLVAINCAAIPEALLEAELFGHTRGAFTGAVQGRTGRIESADGGTLFLDEIGEMPLALQAKLLRFVECGELQRVGDNETVKVDVRIVAATHRPLGELAVSGNFRSDLYYRLAVFLVRTPALAEHAQDLPLLISHFMQQMGRQGPMKRVDDSAMSKLMAYAWPGNVRELEHVLERGSILAGDRPVLLAEDIDFGLSVN